MIKLLKELYRKMFGKKNPSAKDKPITVRVNRYRPKCDYLNLPRARIERFYLDHSRQERIKYITNYIAEHNASLGKSGNKKKIRLKPSKIEAIGREYLAGMTQIEIIKEHHTHSTTINYALNIIVSLTRQYS